MPFARGIGPLELIIILVIVMMIFGVGKLPQVGQAMGKAMREFRKSQNDDAEAPREKQKEVALASQSDDESKKDSHRDAS